MEKIFNTLQLNINEYIESALAGQTACANAIANIDPEQMYNFDVVFEKINKQYKDYLANGYSSPMHKVITSKQTDIFKVFNILKNFLKKADTEMYIGSVDMLLYIIYNSYNCSSNEQNYYRREHVIIKTNRNLCITYNGNLLQFKSFGINEGEVNFKLYFEFRPGASCCPGFTDYSNFYKYENNSYVKLSEKEIEDYCYQIKKLLKYTDPKIYLDYLLTCDDAFVKSFLSTATGPVMIEKSNEIAQLKTKLEDKAEAVELLTEEVAKWKAHGKELEQNRLSMITFKDNEVAKLKKQMEELENNHLQELEQVKQTISNTCESKIKKYDGKIRRIIDDNEKVIKEYQDKITRLTDKVNSELLTNKKLKMELVDINDLYENLQKKIVEQVTQTKN